MKLLDHVAKTLMDNIKYAKGSLHLNYEKIKHLISSPNPINKIHLEFNVSVGDIYAPNETAYGISRDPLNDSVANMVMLSPDQRLMVFSLSASHERYTFCIDEPVDETSDKAVKCVILVYENELALNDLHSFVNIIAIPNPEDMVKFLSLVKKVDHISDRLQLV
jgi:hypothetical protein